MSSISTNAMIKHNGNVTWLSTVIYKSSCSIHVKYFPFDEQVCDMIFASWTFDGYFLDILLNSNEGDLTNFIKNGEWHLVELSATKLLKNYSCCEEPYPEIYYKLRIRRRPLYYVFNMVFPCLLITLVAFLGFFLPPDSSEKVSIGITTLLSLTVFLTLVAESLPPTSEQLPLLGIYYFITIGIVSFSTFMAVVTLNINNKGNKGRRLPRLVKIIFFDYVARVLGTELTNYMDDMQQNNDLSCVEAPVQPSLLFDSVHELKKKQNVENRPKKKRLLHLTSNHIGDHHHHHHHHQNHHEDSQPDLGNVKKANSKCSMHLHFNKKKYVINYCEYYNVKLGYVTTQSKAKWEIAGKIAKSFTVELRSTKDFFEAIFLFNLNNI